MDLRSARTTEHRTIQTIQKQKSKSDLERSRSTGDMFQRERSEKQHREQSKEKEGEQPEKQLLEALVPVECFGRVDFIESVLSGRASLPREVEHDKQVVVAPRSSSDCHVLQATTS